MLFEGGTQRGAESEAPFPKEKVGGMAMFVLGVAYEPFNLGQNGRRVKDRHMEAANSHKRRVRFHEFGS